MKQHVLIPLRMVLTCFLLSITSCSQAQTSAGIEADEALFVQRDVNEDGWLSGNELDGDWLRYDRNEDGEVDKDEFLEGRAADRANDGEGSTKMESLAGATGPGVPRGSYQCYDTYTAVGENTRVSYKEQLIILDESSYQFRKDGPTGAYAYDAEAGVIEWMSGPYAGGNPVGTFSQKEGRDVITLSYTFEKLGTDEDYCVRKD